MKFHERLKLLREESGLNQTQFGTSLGYKQSKYNKWENGINTPDYDSLCDLAEKLNVSTDYLLGRTDIRKANPTIVEMAGLTGLSENAIDILTRLNASHETPVSDAELRLFNDIIECSSFGFIAIVGYSLRPDFESLKTDGRAERLQKDKELDYDYFVKKVEMEKQVQSLFGDGTQIVSKERYLNMLIWEIEKGIQQIFAKIFRLNDIDNL